MNRPSPTADPSPQAESSHPAPSFGRLAQRIWAWTLNLLVTGVLGLIALSVGGEIISAWRGEEAAMGNDTPSRHDSGKRSSLQLAVGAGQQPLAIEHVSGDRAAAVAALMNLAREALAQPASPDKSPQMTPIDPSESHLLQRLAPLTPMVHTNQGEVYELADGVPLVVAVRGADPDRRVVFCGLGFETNAARWAVYGVRRLQSPNAQTFSLPPGGEVIITLQDASSTGTIVFRGHAFPVEWIAFYNTWTVDQGWSIAHDWQHRGEAWNAAFVQHATGRRLEVHLQQSGPGSLRGVLVWSTSSPFEL